MSVEVTAGLREISIPDYQLWGRGDVRSYYDELANAVSELGKDILQYVSSTTDEGRRLRSEYGAFKARFGTAYTAYIADPIWFPVAPGSTVVEQMRAFAGQYNSFESRYRSITGRAPTYVPPTVPTEGGPAEFRIPTVVYVGLGVVALGFASWAAYSASKFVPVLEPFAQRFSSQSSLRGHRIRR